MTTADLIWKLFQELLKKQSEDNSFKASND